MSGLVTIMNVRFCLIGTGQRGAVLEGCNGLSYSVVEDPCGGCDLIGTGGLASRSGVARVCGLTGVMDYQRW